MAPTGSGSTPTAAKDRVLGYLRDDCWNGVRGVASLLTLLVTAVLTVLVYRWNAELAQSHLSIQLLTASWSQDATEWWVQAVVDNNGPRTARDITIEVVIPSVPHTSPHSLTVLHEGARYQLTEPYQASTVRWQVLDPPNTLATRDLDVLHYRQHLDRLAVGDEVVVSARFTTQPTFGEHVVSALHDRTPTPLTNPHGSGPDYYEHAYEQWKMMVLRGYFIHDIEIAGNMLAPSKASLWNPVRFRSAPSSPSGTSRPADFRKMG
jgi:hypothetical protein